ncbi:MAG: hypothetical protein KF726_04655 [Anaerolineae bacterium]|nr:hypothetical protein [Anaerolineae bacterium]
MRRFFLFITTSLLIAAVCGAVFTYDGSYYFFRALNDRQVFIPNRRTIHGLLELPTLLASYLTHDLTLLSLIFNLTYVSLILFSLLLCWWIVRTKKPRLFIWVVFTVCVALLPGQIAYISELAMLLPLAWAIYLSILVGVERHHWLFIIPFSLLIICSHPFAVFLLGIAAILAFLQHQRTIAIAMIGFSVAAVIWFLSGITPYEADVLSTGGSLGLRFTSAVLGLPLVILLLGWFAGFSLLLPVLRERWAWSRNLKINWTERTASRLLTVAVIAGMIWALVPIFWIDALSYRFFLLPFTLPFIIAAWLDNRSSLLESQPRQSVLMRLAWLFTVVIVIQSLFWFAFTDRLKTTLASTTPCLRANTANLLWTNYTAMNHWSITAYSVIIQGDAATSIVLPGDQCEIADFSQGFPVADWDFRRWDQLWFHLQSLADRLNSRQ